MTKPATIAWLYLRRMFRDRTNAFFMLLLPLLMVFLVGLSYGEDRQRLGLVAADDGELAEPLVEALGEESRFTVVEVADAAELRAMVERGEVNAGMVVPADFTELVRGGDTAEVTVLTRPDDWGSYAVVAWVRSVVDQERMTLDAAQFAERAGGAGFDESLRAVEQATPEGIDVEAVTSGESVFPDDVSQFSLAAPPMLLLFTFLIALSTGMGVAEIRNNGIARRMFATPTATGTLVAGEALARLVITLVQALIIMLGSALLFGVGWGDPVATTLVVVTFCLVGSGAAMLVGSLCRTEGAALAAALTVGLVAAGVGGTMVPLEALSGPSRMAAYVTPHAWGYDAFSELIRHGGQVGDILPQLGALVGYAVVLFGVGTLLLRRVITR